MLELNVLEYKLFFKGGGTPELSHFRATAQLE